MSRSRLVWMWPLVLWTVFVWLSRVRNVVDNDELGGGAKTVRVVIAIVFVVFAWLMARMLWKNRNSHFVSTDRFLVGIFALWTVGFWFVRAGGILLGDETVGFKVVHSVLAVISFVVAAMAVIGLRRSEPGVSLRSRLRS